MLQIYRGKAIDNQYIKPAFSYVLIPILCAARRAATRKCPLIPSSYVFFPAGGFFPRFVPAKTRTGAPYKLVIVLKIKSLMQKCASWVATSPLQRLKQNEQRSHPFSPLYLLFYETDSEFATRWPNAPAFPQNPPRRPHWRWQPHQPPGLCQHGPRRAAPHCQRGRQGLTRHSTFDQLYVLV